jgi:putative nucleotidyltransferase with HDIG domain
MLRRRADGASVSPWRRASSLVITAAACAAGIAVGAGDHLSSLSVILGIAAVLAGALAMGEQDGVGLSASFIVFVLAAAFLGPISAALAALIAELAATIRYRTPLWRTVYLNLPPALIPAVACAVIVSSVAGKPTDNADFYLAVGLAGVVADVMGFLLFSGARRLLWPSGEQFGWKVFVEFVPSGALSILVSLAGVGIALKVGNAGIAFALAAVFAFSYMAHLVQQSRQRAQQYASLSWGVLGGLMRALDIRDDRLARHSAAVAHFARDIAGSVGMSAEECELAHTAGLLHDIGRFALADRVFEPGVTLGNDDWEAIQRHPELGADILQDLGMYGPVAEIVLAHHERPDGRGYPKGLYDEQIPEIAKIIAVAEVYDTLTASDTYRTPVSSFEALSELRKHSGRQFAERYVEALAGLLTGEGLEYRHADEADFDRELNMERRLREASGA